MIMLKYGLIKKEINEYMKTSKGFILIAIFIFFALTSPATAKFMNEIIAAVAGDIQVSFPDPTLQDSWIQVFKNMNSICLIVYVILMSASVSQEKSKGSILLVLTKKVSRFQFLLSKFIVGVLVFTILLLVSTIVSAWYTNLLFGGFVFEGLFMSLLLFWLMGVFFTALAIFISVIGKTPTNSALLAFFAYAVLQIINISSDLALYSPAGASTIVNGIIAGTIDMGDLWLPILSALLFSMILFWSSQLFFKKQEI
jgi:ABC-2 type transport system permease protein